MKNTTVLLIILSLINGITLLAQNYGVWKEIDSMNIARVGHAMVVLPNGDVLVSGSEADSIQSSAEIYEFSTGKWRYTTPMNVPRALHNLVLLNTGKVLAIGGYKEQSCELFDPQTETWTMTDSIPTFRYFGQSVTELTDGRIMVAGGFYVDTTTWDFIILKNVDIYDPISEKWINAAQMNLERYGHTATLLNNGRVLISGGDTNMFTTSFCEIYDPIKNIWSIVMSMNENRRYHASILLMNGNVFTSGGRNDAPILKSCEVYLINLNQWLPSSDLLIYRTDHQIYYLRKIDKLMIVGGGFLSFGPDTWEIYDQNQLEPIYYETFPINQQIVDNIVQLPNENLFVSGGWEFLYNPMPNFWASKRSWIFDVTIDVDGNKEILKNYKLNQNFPNPFNPQTTISYELPFNAYVKLIVYDILGNEVELLVNEFQYSGTYDVNFKAKSLSSGIYYYRLTVMETEKSNGITFQQTKKMILLR